MKKTNVIPLFLCASIFASSGASANQDFHYLQIEVPVSVGAANEAPACQAVYQKRLKGLHTREKVTNGIGLGFGIGTGGVVTAAYISNLGLGVTLALGWIGIAPAAVFAWLGTSQLTGLILKDWRNTQTVADWVLSPSLLVSFADLVKTQHALIRAQYELSTNDEMKRINAKRQAAGVPPITLEEVKALFPLRELTDKDRARSVVDGMASELGIDISTQDAFENFRLKSQVVLFSDKMCPTGKSISLKKAKTALMGAS